MFLKKKKTSICFENYVLSLAYYPNRQTDLLQYFASLIGILFENCRLSVAYFPNRQAGLLQFASLICILILKTADFPLHTTQTK